VQRTEIFTGEGMDLFFTPRQQEADEMPYSARNTGSLMKALSGSLSKFTRASWIAPNFSCCMIIHSILGNVMSPIKWILGKNTIFFNARYR